MRKVSWFAIGLVIALGFAGWARWPSLSDRVRHAKSDRTASELDHPNGESSSGASIEVARLRAELRQKDALLRSLASTQQNLTERPAQGVATPQADDTDPTTREVDLLDERMFTAPKDARKAAEMERAVKEAANSPELGEAKVASLYCGSTLCKIALAAKDSTVVNRSMAALGARLPKTFGASAVYELSNGQSAMFVAKSSQDLHVEPVGGERPRPELVMHEGDKSADVSGHQ